MKKDMVVITIPIYKEIPDEYEVISLKQCIDVLKIHPVSIVAPEGLDLSYYLKLFSPYNTPEVTLFKKHYFKNIFGYNRLMLSADFYKRFSNYEYILIYQPDAYVFKDELAYWCAKGYDYIGAPGFKLRDENTRFEFSGVANGGFSLRKVSAMLKLVETWQKHFSLYDILTTKLLNVNSKLQLTYDYLLKGLPSGFQKTPLSIFYKHHEDFVLTNIFSMERKFFSIPTPLESSKFAFEVHPELLFKKNNNELPFGCHAWNKHGTNFWSKFISGLSASSSTLTQKI